MSQEQTELFLRRNRDRWFSVEELLRVMKCGQRALYNNLKSLEKTDSVTVKILPGAGYKNKKLYSYRDDDEEFGNVIKDFQNKRLHHNNLPQSDVISLMLIAELRKQNRIKVV
jgi:hypothetical protein